MSTRSLTYDLNPDDPPPQPNQYLVTVGKKGIGTVYLIKAVRLVKSKIVRSYTRYCLTVSAQPEMKQYTEYERRFRGVNVWVRGEQALPCFWYSRKKKVYVQP